MLGLSVVSSSNIDSALQLLNAITNAQAAQKVLGWAGIGSDLPQITRSTNRRPFRTIRKSAKTPKPACDSE
jgi:hypothetical protein